MKRAFTLIELLVVIAVVGLIGAIMLPVLGRAREAGRRAQCSNNLRQIGIAWHLYLDDHNGRFPDSYDNCQSLFCGKAGAIPQYERPPEDRELNPYLGIRSDADAAMFEVCRCPSDTRNIRFGASQNTFFDHYGTSYLANSMLYDMVSSSITAPYARLMLVVDNMMRRVADETLYSSHSPRYLPSTEINILCLDGHVRMLTVWDEIETWWAQEDDKPVYWFPTR